MLYYSYYKPPEPNILGKRKKFDNNVYTFDIETSSYLLLHNKQISACDYLKLSEDEKEEAKKCSCMYIWMFGINDVVYYGRRWEELVEFLSWLEEDIHEKKYIFVHNLSFEFQFLKTIFHFENVFARKSHKVMSCDMIDYNITFRCTFMMTNVALEKLPKLYNLPVDKKVGQLDYDKIRHSNTSLTIEEMEYCEYDCLVDYYYILFEMNKYENVKNIPSTLTGHVRRELRERVSNDYNYRRKTNIAISTDTHVYNLMNQAFSGGYTHANWLYSDEIIEDVDSYDISSSYPFVMTTEKFPMTQFKKCNLKRLEDMSSRFAYMLVIRLKNVHSNYYNNFISMSKCRNIKKGHYDNGRVIDAEELEITLLDVDISYIKKAYTFDYEILESYSAHYQYLPRQFILFILEKYVNKTKFKGIPEKALDYQIEKSQFNALYGMTTTNTIRDVVVYDDMTKLWSEIPLTNEEIEEGLSIEKKKSFLSFSWGIYVTAYARRNLLERVMDLDEYIIYCDTDSAKLKIGYDKNVFIEYNKSVKNKIKRVCEDLNLKEEQYAPLDIKNQAHMMGVFECETEGNREHTYDKFITQGAKKYAYEIDGKIGITISGVPKKKGAEQLKNIKDFKDDFVFVGKNLLYYVENQSSFMLKDYQGNELEVNDISGCCVLPNTYKLSKSEDYATLLSDNSSKRAIYKE